MSTHRIRLRGFWVVAPVEGGTSHTRNFGAPRSVGPGETVWITCEDAPGPVQVFLTGVEVGRTSESGPFAFEVTDRLQPRNELRILVASPVESLGEVAVEIRMA